MKNQASTLWPVAALLLRVIAGPGSADVLVIVPPEAANRAVTLAISDGEWAASSLRQLNGLDGPKILAIPLRELPEGRVTLRVTLWRADGSSTAVQRELNIPRGEGQP